MTLFFPELPGQGWSVKKTPAFSTRVIQHVSGREVRAARYARALYNFELTFDGLDSSRDYPGLKEQSLQTLMGFYLACQGQFGTFVYVDPTDQYAGNAVFGAGDGSTTAFTLQRPMGDTSEPVSYVVSLGAVTAAGALATGYVLTLPNTITFGAAPGYGVELTASLQYGFLCRFLDDTAEFENVMAGLWSMKSLKFRSVR